MTTAIALGFSSLVRTGELLFLEMKNILVRSNDIFRPLHDTKLGGRAGHVESVSFKGALVANMLKPLGQKRGQEGCLICCSPQGFRIKFTKLVAMLDLANP